MGTGVRHIDRYKTEMCLVTNSTGTGTSLWIDLQWYSHVTFFFATSNSSGTPAAVLTFNQAQDTAGTASKALSVNNYFYCSKGFSAQSSSADSWQSSSFAAVASLQMISTVSTLFGYCVEIHDTDLDLNSNFKAVACSVSGTSSITTALWAHLFPRFDGSFAVMPTALT